MKRRPIILSKQLWLCVFLDSIRWENAWTNHALDQFPGVVLELRVDTSGPALLADDRFMVAFRCNFTLGEFVKTLGLRADFTLSRTVVLNKLRATCQ